MTTIYLPVFEYRDSYGDWQDQVAGEYGYFTSEEAIKAWVEEQNRDEPGYNRRVAFLKLEQMEQDKTHALAVKNWEELKAAGVDPAKYLKEPIDPEPIKIPTYEEWAQVRQAQGGDRYDYVAVDLHEGA